MCHAKLRPGCGFAREDALVIVNIHVGAALPPIAYGAVFDMTPSVDDQMVLGCCSPWAAATDPVPGQ